MRLALSNIAWGRQFDARLLGWLREHGCEGVELAPGLVEWGDNDEYASELSRLLREADLQCVGLHSLLFERQEWRVVNAADREPMLAYLTNLGERCAALAGKFLVFGSPPARACGELPRDEAWKVLTDFCHNLAERVQPVGVQLLIEPLPKADLVHNWSEGIALVEAVGHPVFGLHADIRTMASNRSPPSDFEEQAALLRHVHSGGSKLSFIGDDDGVDHRDFGAALSRVGYDGFVTLEMVRAGETPDLPRLEEALDYAKRRYY